MIPSGQLMGGQVRIKDSDVSFLEPLVCGRMARDIAKDMSNRGVGWGGYDLTYDDIEGKWVLDFWGYPESPEPDVEFITKIFLEEIK